MAQICAAEAPEKEWCQQGAAECTAEAKSASVVSMSQQSYLGIEDEEGAVEQMKVMRVRLPSCRASFCPQRWSVGLTSVSDWPT